jgi:hypothetical protein
MKLFTFFTALLFISFSFTASAQTEKPLTYEQVIEKMLEEEKKIEYIKEVKQKYTTLEAWGTENQQDQIILLVLKATNDQDLKNKLLFELENEDIIYSIDQLDKDGPVTFTVEQATTEEILFEGEKAELSEKLQKMFQRIKEKHCETCKKS